MKGTDDDDYDDAINFVVVVVAAPMLMAWSDKQGMGTIDGIVEMYSSLKSRNRKLAAVCSIEQLWREGDTMHCAGIGRLWLLSLSLFFERQNIFLCFRSGQPEILIKIYHVGIGINFLYRPLLLNSHVEDSNSTWCRQNNLIIEQTHNNTLSLSLEVW